MCGDVVDGLELAVGPPAAVPFGPPRPAGSAWGARAGHVDAASGDRQLSDRDIEERRMRIDNDPIVKEAWAASMGGYRWLKAHAGAMRAAGDAVLVEALDVATHDSFLVTVKLTRAVDGRDVFERGAALDDEPVQNDWNGSAKVALVCLERSSAAWRVIADAAGDPSAREIAEQVDALRRAVDRAFPLAHAFVRPGFDERGA